MQSLDAVALMAQELGGHLRVWDVADGWRAAIETTRDAIVTTRNAHARASFAVEALEDHAIRSLISIASADPDRAPEIMRLLRECAESEEDAA